MSNRRTKLAKKKANEKGRLHREKIGPGRYSVRSLVDKATGLGLRASSPRGIAARLAARIAEAPKSKVPADLDYKNYTYCTPGAPDAGVRTDKWAPK